jgi:hypothetical protein
MKRSNADYLYNEKKQKVETKLKCFNDLKQKNHPIKDLMINECKKIKEEKYILMYSPRTDTICFIGKNKLDAFIKLYDYLNTEKCLCPFDRHMMCLDSFLDSFIFNGKEFDEADVKKFDLTTLNKELVKNLMEEYCNFDPFDGELIGTSQIL